jgi:pimeloyl-ACP methyl ester carboxylesterase
MQIVANGLGIEVDDQGPASGEPILLIMGLGMQLIAWPQELVQLLVSRGFRVLRMDNRDIGLSQGFDHLGKPPVAWAMLQYALHLPVPTAYTLSDMAKDAVGVLDALGIRRAHLCGASMGGMVAQHLAAAHGDRVKSLSLIMTTSGARHLPQPSFKVRAALLKRRPSAKQPEALLNHLGQLMTLIGSPAHPAHPAELRSRLRAAVERAWRPAGSARQLIAIAADGDRTPMLSRISTPTHIIHGEADPLVPVAAGHDLAARILGATADFIPGMGHDLPAALLARMADGIARLARRAG